MIEIDYKCNNRENTKFNETYPETLLKIKHFNNIGRYSTLILTLNIKTLEHITIQSIHNNSKDDILHHVTSESILENEFILKYLHEIIPKVDSPVTWMIYENTFCTLDDYISIIKLSPNPIENYFTPDSNGDYFKELYTVNMEKFSFNMKLISLVLIYQLFEIINILNEKNLNRLFNLQNILLTVNGKLKIFPCQDDSNHFKTNKDADDVAIELYNDSEEIQIVLNQLQFNKHLIENCDNSDYLRNIFAAGLVSIRILFRDWTPFKVDNIKHIQCSDTNQKLWTVKSIYDPLIKDFIKNGLLKSINKQEKIYFNLINFLIDIFQPRFIRKCNIETINFITTTININLELDLLIKFLHQHYIFIFHKDSRNTSSNNSNRKRQFDDNFILDRNNSVSNRKSKNNDSCEMSGENNFEGISNWLNDGPSFKPLAEFNEDIVNTPKIETKTCNLKNRKNKDNYEGISNWVDDADSFKKLIDFNELIRSNEKQSNCKKCNTNSLEPFPSLNDDGNSCSRSNRKKMYDIKEFNEESDTCGCQKLGNDSICQKIMYNSENFDYVSPFDEISDETTEDDESTLSKIIPTLKSFVNKINPFQSDCSNCEITLPSDVAVYDERISPKSGSANTRIERDVSWKMVQLNNFNSEISSIQNSDNNHTYLNSVLPNAKSVKLKLTNIPQPIVTCQTEDNYSLYYDFDKFGLYVDGISGQFINNEIDNMNDVELNDEINEVGNLNDIVLNDEINNDIDNMNDVVLNDEINNDIDNINEVILNDEIDYEIDNLNDIVLNEEINNETIADNGNENLMINNDLYDEKLPGLF